MVKTTRESIANEATNGLKNTRGTVAMARTNDVDSATSQFFINVELNGSLDHTNTENSRSWGYTVFGRIVEGMNVIDQIGYAATGPGPVPELTKDVPAKPIVILKMTMLNDDIQTEVESGVAEE